jgi:hypothetical protein
MLGLVVVCVGTSGCISSLMRSSETLGRSMGGLLGEAGAGERMIGGAGGEEVLAPLRVVKQELPGRLAAGGGQFASSGR